MKMQLQTSSVKWLLFCPGGAELKYAKYLNKSFIQFAAPNTRNIRTVLPTQVRVCPLNISTNTLLNSG